MRYHTNRYDKRIEMKNIKKTLCLTIVLFLSLFLYTCTETCKNKFSTQELNMQQLYNLPLEKLEEVRISKPSKKYSRIKILYYCIFISRDGNKVFESLFVSAQ